jgi:hypothetical protein
MKPLYALIACTFLCGQNHAQTVGGSPSRLSLQQALAAEVESHSHIEGFNLRLSGDASSAEGPRRRPPHRTDLRADARQQGTVWAKPRCRLLSLPATSSKSVRRP